MTAFWKISLNATKEMFASFFLGMMLFGLPWFAVFLIVLLAAGAAAAQSSWMLLPAALAAIGIAVMIARSGYRHLRPLGRRAWLGGLASMISALPVFFLYLGSGAGHGVSSGDDAGAFLIEIVRRPSLLLGVAAFLFLLGFFTFLGGCAAALQAHRTAEAP